MRRSRTLAAAAAIVVAGMMVLTLSPPQGTDAQWRDTATVSVTGPRSDTFNMTATNVPFPAPPWPSSGRVSNSPRINVTNESARHSSWVNVVSTKLSRFPSENNNPAANLVPRIALDYELGLGHELGVVKCELGFDTYWAVGDVGQISENTLNRPQDKVTFATLAPGQTRSLCPAVRLNYATSTEAGLRDAFLNHAGRALDITTVVNQKSESPATWASEPRTAVSRYRISMPPPTTPSDGSKGVCRNTTALGAPSSNSPRGGFFWGWPDAGTNYSAQRPTPRPTPAMAGGWELFRKSATTEAWSSFYEDYGDGQRRHRAGFSGDSVNRDLPPGNNATVRQFKLLGYPFTLANGQPDKTRYVESNWIARVRGDDNFYCESPLVGGNPNAGPHNMP